MMARENSIRLDLTLTLPDSLAQEANAWGLLNPSSLVDLLRSEIRRRRVDNLFDAADRLAGLVEPSLTEAEVEAEIQAARSQKHPGASRR